MSPNRWSDLAERFTELRELHEAAREARLRELDAQYPELALELRRLLASSAVANDFLEPPPAAQVDGPLRMLSFDFRGLKLGEFELVREIGRGASGVVYLGMQGTLDRKVAIKILAPQLVGSPNARKRFEREARAASGLRHPAIVSLLSYGEQQGAAYLVLEYVEGRSLHQHLETLRLARLDGQAVEEREDLSRPELAARIAAELAEGLDYCHRQGVLHRDIKPHNILLDRELAPRIVDFGLAKDLKLEEITEAGLVSGTLHYMSPEQARARSKDIDSRTDIYSLGVVLYEMLTLQRPFEGAPDAALVERVLHQRPVPPHEVASRVPKALSAICMRALEKLPADRQASAGEFSRELRAFLAGQTLPVGGRERTRRAVRYVFVKRPWIAAAGFVALAGLAAMELRQFGSNPVAMASDPLDEALIRQKVWDRYHPLPGETFEEMVKRRHEVENEHARQLRELDKRTAPEGK